MSDDTPTSVYKYFDEYGILLYVGITNRGMQRQREHNKDKDWWQYVASQFVEHFPSRGEALDREAWLITTHTPPFNTQLNPNHKTVSASYKAFRKLPTHDQSPLEIVQEAGKQIPLNVVSHDGNELTLSTPAKFAPILSLLKMDKGMRGIAGTARCAGVISAEPRGVSMEVLMQIKRGIVVDNPFLRVTVNLSKTGATFTGKNIQLAA